MALIITSSRRAQLMFDYRGRSEFRWWWCFENRLSVSADAEMIHESAITNRVNGKAIT